MVGCTLVEAGVCKDASGAFANGAASLLQGSLELVTDAVSQTQDVLGYKASRMNGDSPIAGSFSAESAAPSHGRPQEFRMCRRKRQWVTSVVFAYRYLPLKSASLT